MGGEGFRLLDFTASQRNVKVLQVYCPSINQYLCCAKKDHRNSRGFNIQLLFRFEWKWNLIISLFLFISALNFNTLFILTCISFDIQIFINPFTFN